jgi:2-polyprenyl-3-methyl-5-hydroxy-6-metoxy-1,4-benzoquinol methylase
MTDCNLCGFAFEASTCTRWRKDGYQIVECPSCGLLFRAELPSRAELDEIYAASYFSSAVSDLSGQGYLDYVADAESHRAAARRRLDRIERLTRPGRLLDVGAAAGFFVAEAGNRGWAARGVDVSAAMVDWGREELGVRLDRGDMHELGLEPAGFDAVTMWDYIEHSRDPAADILATRALLAPGGILALSTGDAASVVARVSGRRWHLLTPRHHNFFFSARTIAALLERSGFRVLSAAHPGAYYPLAYLAHKLRTVADTAPVRALAARAERSSLAELRVPVNLFDIVTVVARTTSIAE